MKTQHKQSASLRSSSFTLKANSFSTPFKTWRDAPGVCLRLSSANRFPSRPRSRSLCQWLLRGSNGQTPPTQKSQSLRNQLRSFRERDRFVVHTTCVPENITTPQTCVGSRRVVCVRVCALQQRRDNNRPRGAHDFSWRRGKSETSTSALAHFGPGWRGAQAGGSVVAGQMKDGLGPRRCQHQRQGWARVRVHRNLAGGRRLILGLPCHYHHAESSAESSRPRAYPGRIAERNPAAAAGCSNIPLRRSSLPSRHNNHHIHLGRAAVAQVHAARSVQWDATLCQSDGESHQG